MVMLWLLLPLLHQPGETCVMAPMSAKRELTCLQFLWLLESPSSLLAGAWSTPSSANSVVLSSPTALLSPYGLYLQQANQTSFMVVGFQEEEATSLQKA